MRISDAMRFKMAFQGLTQPRERLGTIQEQVTSGRLVNRPSDDPAGAARVLDLRESLTNIEQFRRDADRARTLLGASEEALGGIEDIVHRMQELAVHMASATVSSDDRKIAAAEVDGAIENVLALANTRVGGVFVFGGFQTEGEPPFVEEGVDRGRYREQAALDLDPETGVLKVDVAEGYVRLDAKADIAEVAPALTGLVSQLSDFSDALRQGYEDQAGWTAQTALVEQSIEDLSGGLNDVLNARSDVGTKLSRIGFAHDVLDRVETDVRTQMSAAEDADMVSVLTQFRQEELALQASLRMAAQMFQPSLMEFLR